MRSNASAFISRIISLRWNTMCIIAMCIIALPRLCSSLSDRLCSRPDRENSHSLSKILTSLGMMGEQLGVPLNPSIRWCCDVRRVPGGILIGRPWHREMWVSRTATDDLPAQFIVPEGTSYKPEHAYANHFMVIFCFMILFWWRQLFDLFSYKIELLLTNFVIVHVFYTIRKVNNEYVWQLFDQLKFYFFEKYISKSSS